MTDDHSELKMAYLAIEKELPVRYVDNSEEAWMKAIVEGINDLILNDFNRLILLLYRLDISESKLRKLLEEQTPGNTANTAERICHLIVERQIEKIRSRKQYRPDENISEEDKW